MKSFFTAGMLLVSFCAGLSHAADFRVGIVDTERILRESAPAAKAEKRIEKEFSGRNQEIQMMLKQSKQLQSSLEKDGNKMSDVDHRNKERELTALNVNLQRMQREYREDLSLRKNEELGAVLEQVSRAVQTIAETEKYDLVLDAQVRVYHNPRIDVTEKVIKFLAIEKADTK